MVEQKYLLTVLVTRFTNKILSINMNLEIKNTLPRYDKNKSRPRPRQKYTRYKMRLSTMMVICTKQHLINIK